MGEILRGLRQGLAGKAVPPPRPDPKGCPDCGLIFSSETAWSVHLEPAAGGRTRCMPESRIEGSLLVQRDGVWHLAGSDSAR